MRLQNWFLSVLSLPYITAGHGGLKILGGLNAVSSLKPRASLPSAPGVNHVIQRRAHMGLVDERAAAPMGLVNERTTPKVNSRCGAVNGSCAPGYWYVQTASLRKDTL